MADFSAADVAALRKATGAGMMDCKKALAGERRRHGGGQGLAAQEGSRRARASAPGVPRTRARSTWSSRAASARIVELTAETDFVAKGADFTETVAELARLAVEAGKDELAELAFEGSTVGEHVTQLAAKLGENVALGRVVVFETRRRRARRLQARPERPGHDRRARRARRRRPGPTRRRRRSRTTSRCTSRRPRRSTCRVTTCRPTWSRRSARSSRSSRRNEGKPENAIAEDRRGSAQRLLQGQRACSSRAS